MTNWNEISLRYQVIKDFLKNRSWPTKSSIYWYVHFNKYGFNDRCVKRVDRRLVIDTLAFEAWVSDFESHGEHNLVKRGKR